MGILPQRPLYRWLLVAGSLLGVLLGTLGCWAIYSRSSLSSRIEGIRAAGYPATIADLAPKAIPADEDAAAQLATAALRFDAFAKEHGRFYNTPEGRAYESQQRRGKGASAEQLAAIRAIVERYPELDDAIERAAACDSYASRLDFSLPQPQLLQAMLDQSSNLRTVARFVRWQMELAAADGRPDEAVQKGIDLLRLAALYDAEPALNNSMVAMAVRASAASAIRDALVADSDLVVSSGLRAELDRELARFRAEDSLRQAIVTERAYVISATMQHLDDMNVIAANTIGLPMKTSFVESIDLIDPMLELADHPWHEVFKPGSQNVFQSTGRTGAMASLLAPSFKAHFDLVHRTSATLRSLRVLSALQQYAIEHGREPVGTSDLNLPAADTIDPFSGQPLIVKPTAAGWLVYSVGMNGFDDGGEFTTPKDFGVGPSKPATAKSEPGN
ncbi:hypothetical protein [Lacipirellula limnantheis]|uniref:Uncharacterized protein n=1 Tax=Lacipirellula limnantheis TaxID=2528024 RepID=A0A517TRU6_9BACT|nr:hypothetical protein [Lacipirellula limnantheis]QDT71090.1 hypothetical protein I41_02450 [Lacipirellula limnantheis]